MMRQIHKSHVREYFLPFKYQVNCYINDNSTKLSLNGKANVDDALHEDDHKHGRLRLYSDES